MIDLKTIYHHEIYFCESFTQTARTEYGVIFYNPDNPQSHDSNHAHILSFDHDLDVAIRDIVKFYRSKNLIPRIRASFLESELELLEPRLSVQGFSITLPQTTFMHFSRKSNPYPKLPRNTRCHRITALSQEIVDLIHTDDDGDWTIHVLERHLQDEHFHLLGLYLDDVCRAIASVKIMLTYSRIDDVLTHAAFRGKHLALRLINYLQAYHASVSENQIYLWAENPIAIKLYRRTDFRPFAIERPTWFAWLPES